MSDTDNNHHSDSQRSYPLFRQNLKLEQLYDKYKKKYEKYVSHKKFSAKDFVWMIVVFAILLSVPFTVNEIQKRQSTTSQAGRESSQIVVVETELASLSEAVRIFESKSASGEKYVRFSPIGSVVDTSTCPDLPENTGKVIFNIDIPFTAEYYFWARMMAPNNENDSFYLTVDNKCALVIGDKSAQPNAWQWTNSISNGREGRAVFDLSKGTHEISLVGRESNVSVDKLLFTTDEGCTPVLMGNNCATKIK